MSLELTEADVRRHYERIGLPVPDWLQPEGPTPKTPQGFTEWMAEREAAQKPVQAP